MPVENFGDGGLGGFLVDEDLPAAKVATRDCRQRLLTARGKPRDVVFWMWVTASSVKGW